MSSSPDHLRLADGGFLAYHQHHATSSTAPHIIFLGGLMSDMQGTKATALEAFCKAQDYNFIRFDYNGHGESSGTFVEGTIGRWKENALAIIDHCTKGPLILIGSSLGGWLMVLAALARPDRVVSLIGIASAPDFTERLMWEQFDTTIRNQLETTGLYQMPSEYSECPYPVAYSLITEARNHLILDKPIALHCPVRLLHGMQDDDVPYHFSVELAERITHADVEVRLLKSGDHRMSDPHTVQTLCTILQETIASYKNNL